MEILARISEGNGWVLTVTGIGTVFMTLICIWLFLTVFSIFTDRKPKENPVVDDNDNCGCVEVAPIRDQTPPQKEEGSKAVETSETMEQTEIYDDTLPKMAAAAAVSAYLQRRKRRAAARTTPVVGFSGWVISGRSQSLFNQPPRNPWKGGK